jgi:hypothetical protein
MIWIATVARMGTIRNAYRMLVKKPERKGSFVTRRHTWDDNIKTDPEGKGC